MTKKAPKKVTAKDLQRKIKKAKHELDGLWSERVRARDGRCVVCGATEHLTAGHLLTRKVEATRWDERNIFAQCRGCNFRHEFQPHLFMLWFILSFGWAEFIALCRRHGCYEVDGRRRDASCDNGRDAVVEGLAGRGNQGTHQVGADASEARLAVAALRSRGHSKEALYQELADLEAQAHQVATQIHDQEGSEVYHQTLKEMMPELFK